MDKLFEAIRRKEARVAVIGLGYVGLPVACMFARAGFAVVGIRRNEEKVAHINKGLCPIEGKEPGLSELLARVVADGRLRASTDYALCREAQVALVTVETPVERTDRRPAYRALRAALRSLGQNLSPGVLVIVESTIAPRTMSQVVQPILEESSGLKVNEGFYLANCPERVMVGRLLANLENCARVVGGMNQETARLAVEFYRHVVKADLDATDCLTAELVKTTENAYRDVQIAFANEVALLCENVGADVYQVRELVNKSPGRAMHLPGAGVGGHCIPKDPWLLVHGTEGKHQARLIPIARAINDGMPWHMVELTEEALAEAGKSIRGARIAVLGYAFIENSDDTRDAPTIPFVARLKELGAEAVVQDPYVQEYNLDLKEAISGADAVVVMVAHDQYRALPLADLRDWTATPVLVDGRHVFDKEKARQSGLVYRGVGNL